MAQRANNILVTCPGSSPIDNPHFNEVLREMGDVKIHRAKILGHRAIRRPRAQLLSIVKHRASEKNNARLVT